MTIRWEAAGATDVGRLRRDNEDAFLVDAPHGVFLVGDGMGGHAAGEVASALAVEVVGRELIRAVEAGATGEAMAQQLRVAFQRAWTEIVRCCRADPAKEGMGTTLTACVLSPAGVGRIAHIGDSRAYLLRGGRLSSLTHDHTWVQRELDAGRLGAAAAEVHPFAHILTRVLAADLPPEPDLLSAELQPGDLLLLTTDGLHGLVPEPEIREVAARELPLEALTAALIERANRRGGRDNITVVAVRILAAAPAETSDTAA